MQPYEDEDWTPATMDDVVAAVDRLADSFQRELQPIEDRLSEIETHHRHMLDWADRLRSDLAGYSEDSRWKWSLRDMLLAVIAGLIMHWF